MYLIKTVKGDITKITDVKAIVNLEFPGGCSNYTVQM